MLKKAKTTKIKIGKTANIRASAKAIKKDKVDKLFDDIQEEVEKVHREVRSWNSAKSTHKK